MTQLNCGQCGKPFERRTAEVNQATQRGNAAHYCSRACLGLAKRRREIISADCKQRGAPFSRLPHGKKERALFCSRKCGARYKSAHRVSGSPACVACGGPKSYSG